LENNKAIFSLQKISSRWHGKIVAHI